MATAARSLEQPADRPPHRYAPPPRGLVATMPLEELLRSAGRPPLPMRLPFAADAERLVWTAGCQDLLQAPCVAIVGSRAVSREGAARARRLARELVGAGVVIVSGLAKGVDTEALTAAIDAGGRVIAVIGTPLDRAYPAENAALQERIYRDHLLLSPYAEGARVFRGNFPARNRLMAALSDATVIVEAGDTSGTLHQAVECDRLGRWLLIAQSILTNGALSWPLRFRDLPKVRALTDTRDVLAVLPSR